MTGLVGFRLESGTILCVDCDVYPPRSTNIYTDDAENVERAENKVCDECGTPLSEVWPVGMVC